MYSLCAHLLKSYCCSTLSAFPLLFYWWLFVLMIIISVVFTEALYTMEFRHHLQSCVHFYPIRSDFNLPLMFFLLMLCRTLFLLCNFLMYFSIIFTLAFFFFNAWCFCFSNKCYNQIWTAWIVKISVFLLHCDSHLDVHFYIWFYFFTAPYSHPIVKWRAWACLAKAYYFTWSLFKQLYDTFMTQAHLTVSLQEFLLVDFFPDIAFLTINTNMCFNMLFKDPCCSRILLFKDPCSWYSVLHVFCEIASLILSLHDPGNWHLNVLNLLVNMLVKCLLMHFYSSYCLNSLFIACLYYLFEVKKKWNLGKEKT